MWPRAKPLSNLVEAGDDLVFLEKVLLTYTNILYGDLHDGEQQMRSAATAVEDSLENLNILLKDFKQTSDINKDFIM